jgi:hypothetical protein
MIQVVHRDTCSEHIIQLEKRIVRIGDLKARQYRARCLSCNAVSRAFDESTLAHDWPEHVGGTIHYQNSEPCLPLLT